MFDGIYDPNEKSLVDNYPGRRPDTLGVTYKLDSRLEAAFLTGAKYFLEIRDSEGATKAFYAFPYDPVAVSYDRPTAAKFTHTINGSLIREFSSIRNTLINITGLSGYKQRLVVNRFGGLVYASGKEAYLELDEFLKQYHEFCASKTANHKLSRSSSNSYQAYRKNKHDGGWRMVFHSLDENISYFVEPLSFTASKDIARYRHSYGFNLQLKAYAYDVNKLTDFSLFGAAFDAIDAGLSSAAFYAAFATAALEGADSQVITKIRGVLGNAQNVIQEYNNAFNTLGNTIANAVRIASDLADVKSELAETWNNITTGGFLDSVALAGNNVANSWVNSTEFIDPFFVKANTDVVLPSQPQEDTDEVALTESVSQELRVVLKQDPELFFDLISSGLINDYINGTSTATKETEDFYKSFSSSAEFRYQVELLRGYIPKSIREESKSDINYLGQFLINDNKLFDLANNNGVSGSLNNGEEVYTQYIPYILSEGETLFEAAFRSTGDENNWTSLRDINKWTSHDRNSLNAMPKAGDTILVPTANLLQTRQNPTLGSSKEGLLASDFLLNKNDLMFSRNDIMLSSGLQNVEQSIAHRVLTLKGEIPNLASFGLEELLGTTVSENSVDYIRLMITKSLLADTRITSIYDTKVKVSGSFVDFSCKIKTIINEEIEITIPIN